MDVSPSDWPLMQNPNPVEQEHSTGTSPPTSSPANRHRQRLQERKYFDSGDYAMCKAGQPTSLGQLHPKPEAIPHCNSSGSVGRSPMKEQISSEDLLIIQEEEETEEKKSGTDKGGGFAQ